MQLGALDYFEKGREPDELFHRIDRALAAQALRHENETLRREIAERYVLPGIVFRSAAMRRVLDLVARVAPTDATVLIQGESGTGKELIARAIHGASRRAPQAFVALNCGALPEALLDRSGFPEHAFLVELHQGLHPCAEGRSTAWYCGRLDGFEQLSLRGAVLDGSAHVSDHALRPAAEGQNPDDDHLAVLDREFLALPG